MTTTTKKNNNLRNGCLLPLGLYVLVLVGGYFATRPAIVTENFDDHIARSFSVAVVFEQEAGYEYGLQKLQSIIDRNALQPTQRYLLPEPEITISVGDIHHARILEDHGSWQLIRFDYSNTYIATSIYRAYRDRIEPVSYQLHSSIGDAVAAALVTMLAVALYLLVALINFVRRRVARKELAAQQD